MVLIPYPFSGRTHFFPFSFHLHFFVYPFPTSYICTYILFLFQVQFSSKCFFVFNCSSFFSYIFFPSTVSNKSFPTLSSFFLIHTTKPCYTYFTTSDSDSFRHRWDLKSCVIGLVSFSVMHSLLNWFSQCCTEQMLLSSSFLLSLSYYLVYLFENCYLCPEM